MGVCETLKLAKKLPPGWVLRSTECAQPGVLKGLRSTTARVERHSERGGYVNGDGQGQLGPPPEPPEPDGGLGRLNRRRPYLIPPDWREQHSGTTSAMRTPPLATRSMKTVRKTVRTRLIQGRRDTPPGREGLFVPWAPRLGFGLRQGAAKRRNVRTVK